MADRPPRIGLCHGGAQGVYEESVQVQGLLQEVGAEVTFLAANEAGIQIPCLDHWGSLHPNKFKFWITLRAQHRLPETYTRWSVSKNQYVDRVIRNWRGGSSGLHIVDVALNALQLDGAVLCGIPMDERPNAFRRAPWGHFSSFRSSWTHREALPVLQARARSMSGWTQQLLGAPDKRWLEGFVATRPAQP